MYSLIILTGCASHASRTAQSLQDRDDYRTLRCQEKVLEAKPNDNQKLARMVVSPVAVIASGGTLLIPVLIGNASLETRDHMAARRIAQNCGGEPKSDHRIAAEVAGSTALSIITQGAQIGPVGDVAQNARR